jgi:hypothetical protein
VATHHHKDNLEVQQDNVDPSQLRPSRQINTSKRSHREWRELSKNSFYEQKQDFAVLDQVIFDTPLEVMITRPLRSKKHWVCLAQKYHPSTYDRKTGKQYLITSFFPKLTSKHKSQEANLKPHTKTTKTHQTKEKTAFR